MRRPERVTAAQLARRTGRAVARGAGRLVTAAGAGGRAAADALRTSDGAHTAHGVRASTGSASSRAVRAPDGARSLTAARLLDAWSAVAPDGPSVAAPLMAAADGSPVHLIGSLPDVAFDIAGTESLVDARAIWTRTIEPGLAPSLERAVNDWNRDHVWPTVWTERTEGGAGAVSVHGSLRLDCATGVSDAQLRAFLDVALQSFATFFTALDAAAEPGGSPAGEQDDTPEGPAG